MKIAITGGTAGIGQAIGDVYEAQGHEVARLSRRTGHNIRSVPKVADAIMDSDMFINNAQSGFAQIELLFEMCQRWQGTKKTIVVISTLITQDPMSVIPGLDMELYRIQKLALEEAVQQLRFKRLGLKIILVRPGKIATTPGQTPPVADPVNWAKNLVDIMESAEKNNLCVTDISLEQQPWTL